jgi:hypothetical protein
MSFLNPIFLFALLTVAVPLLIYLLNLRKPKKIRFSTLAFFDSLKSTALKRIKIKRWLLLAIRVLAIIALVFAAARPFLPPEFGWAAGSAPKATGILLDNSPSMDRVDRHGPYLDQAINLAGKLIDISGNEDMFLLNVTNGESLNLPALSQRAAGRQLGNIESVNAGNFLRERIRMMANSLEDASEPNKLLYIITDAQATQFDGFESETAEQFRDINVQVIRIGEAETSNIGFENVVVEYGGRDSDGNLQLRVVVRNFGDRDANNQFISMLMDGELISQQAFGIGIGEASEFLFEIPLTETRSIPIELLIEGDELTFDNRFYTAIQLPETRNILVVSDNQTSQSFTSYLRPVFEIADEEMNRFQFDFTGIDEITISDLVNYHAVVLDGVRNIPDYISQALVDYVQEGAGLLFLPAADGNINSYNRLLSYSGAGSFQNVRGSYGSFNPVDRMQTPSEGHPILDNMFDKTEDEEIRLNVPELFYFYEIEQRSRASTVNVLETRTGSPLVTDVRVGNGNIMLAAIGSDPGWSNFPIKPFFAPFFLRTLEYLVRGEGANLNVHTLGEEFTAILERNVEMVRIIKQEEIILPERIQSFRGTEISYPAVEWMPGWLTVEVNGINNLYSSNQNAMESQLSTLGIAEIEGILASKFRYVKASDAGADNSGLLTDLELATFGREIWYWFVLIAIILLLLESMVSRHYKAETLG